MKRIKIFVIICLFIFLFASNAFAANFPKPTSAFYVNDYANVLDTQTEQYIESTARTLDDVTSAQVVVVTVNGIGDNILEDYTIGLFREWGIGNKEKNNGVLLFVDVKGRQSRIEVGYGLEGALPDGKTGRIQDNYMLPYFKQGNYSYGIKEGFDAIVNEVYTEYGYNDRLVGNKQLAPYRQGSNGGNNRTGTNENPGHVTFVAVILVVIFIILDFRFFQGMITFSILRALSRGGRGGGRGGWGGGSFGGGGRRGGGGSAGGGGSSRRW